MVRWHATSLGIQASMASRAVVEGAGHRLCRRGRRGFVSQCGRGKFLQGLPGVRKAKGKLWQPGAGGMCLHTIILDPSNPNRMFIAISAAGTFRTDDGGKTW